MTALTSPVSITELRTELDAKTSTITSNKRLGQKDSCIPFRVESISSGGSSSIAWTQQDDQEIRAIMVRVTDTGTGATVTATVTGDDGTTTYLVDQDITVSVAAINGTVQASTDYRTTTGVRARLLAGVRYRMTVTSTGAAVGVTEASLQVRSVRRGGAGGPALVPNRLRSTGNLDVDLLNADILAIAGDIEDSQDARYTYSRQFFLLDGIADTSAAVLRQFPIRRVGTNNAIEVVSVEMVIVSATAGVTWTLSKVGDTLWPTIAIDTDDATINGDRHAETSIPASVSSSSSDLVLQVAADTAAGNSITTGYLVVHTRADRWNQGSTLTRFTPTMLDSSSSTASTVVDAYITAIASRVTEDTAADVDLRVECFVARSLADGASKAWHVPSGAREILGSVAYIVGAAGSIATCTVVGTGLTGSSCAVTSTGATVRDVNTDAASGSMNNDPTDENDDATVTIAISGGVTADLVVLLVFWQ